MSTRRTRRTRGALFIGGVAAGAIAGAVTLATAASAAPVSPFDGPRDAGLWLSSGVSAAADGSLQEALWLGPGAPPAPPTPPDGTSGGVGGHVSAVSGSTYTIGGPQGTSLTVKATSDTKYVNADGSAADAAAVKAGVAIAAEVTFSDQGKTLTAQRITVGAPEHGLSVGPSGSWSAAVEGPRSGAPPPPPDGAHVVFGGPVSAVSGSTYTLAGPGGSMTVKATSDTKYVNADGSAADAAAVKTGVVIFAQGTVSDQGKTLTAQRITIGRPEGGVFTVTRA